MSLPLALSNYNPEVVMPEGYEKIRDSYINRGMDEEEAKRIAAATWNKNHPDDPVTRNYDESGGTNNSSKSLLEAAREFKNKK